MVALLRWLDTVEPPEAAVVACGHGAPPRVPRGTIGVRWGGCVADADVGLPSQLLACGIGRVEFVACGERAVAERVREWGSVLDGVALAPGGPRPRGPRRGPVFDLRTRTVRRRGALGLGAPRRHPVDPALPERDRTLIALRTLAGEGRAHLPDGGSGPAAATLLRASGCTACGVCVRACPHGALDLVVDGRGATLRHVRDYCLLELECVRLCPMGALSADGGLTLLDIARRGTVEVATVATGRCRRCGAQHPAAEGDLCPACAFRAAHPFGSRMPPGAGARSGSVIADA